MTTEFVTSADGTRIASEMQGTDGPVLILVHGAAGDRHYHAELLPLLTPHCRVVIYDRRGRGQSTDGPEYDFLREADDLLAVLAAHPGAAVLGISMGGRIALEALRSAPDMAALFIFEAPATDVPDPVFAERLAQVRTELDRHGAEAATDLHSRLFHNRTQADIDAMKADADAWALRVRNVHVTLREMEAVHRDCLFDAGAYQVPGFPVHLMTGDATLPFLKHSGALIRALPFVQTHDLPGMTHSAPREHPDVVAGIVLSHL